MKALNKILFALLFLSIICAQALAAEQPERRKAIVLTETGGQHDGFVKAALKWLDWYGGEHNIDFTIINDTKKIDAKFLAEHRIFIQLNYPPYNWTDTAKIAFERAIIDGTIGWVGFHHATLLGDFDGFKMWNWFSKWMGNIRFKNYIAPTATGKVAVERNWHPVMKNVAHEFLIENDEWYTYDRSPRQDVSVLASVNEESYFPSSDVRMGDHPVVWINEKVKARNVYFQFGHDAKLFDNINFTTMFANAIEWTASGAQWFPRFRALVSTTQHHDYAHTQFSATALKFIDELRVGDGMVFDITHDVSDFNDENLRTYDLVICLDDHPGHTPEQRAAFQRYMENGGAWLGFHAAAYNDASTNWPWYVDFLGGGVFYRNNWPPLAAKVEIDAPKNPIMKGMPKSYIAPLNEWYHWKPSPRKNPNVKVLASLAKENYPLGMKDEIPDGDTPVAWTNTKYNMVYLNMGHGTHTFEDATQNYFITNAIRWLVRKKYENK